LIASLAFRAAIALLRLMFFPESDHCVGTKQKKDDEEIQPVLDQRGQDHGAFNHPRNGTPEIGEEL
jgi:hypothetical protein